MHTENTEQQKVTAYVPKDLIQAAQQVTGQGISETLRTGLEYIARKHAYHMLLELRGSYKSGLSLEESREDR